MIENKVPAARTVLATTDWRCDSCALLIHGIRWKCLMCANIDFCSDCESHDRMKPSSTSSPSLPYHQSWHILAKIHDSSLHQSSPAVADRSSWIHTGFTCQPCGRAPIIGFRYMCTCCGISICDACEFTGQHDYRHPRLKFGPPVHDASHPPPTAHITSQPNGIATNPLSWPLRPSITTATPAATAVTPSIAPTAVAVPSISSWPPAPSSSSSTTPTLDWSSTPAAVPSSVTSWISQQTPSPSSLFPTMSSTPTPTPIPITASSWTPQPQSQAQPSTTNRQWAGLVSSWNPSSTTPITASSWQPIQPSSSSFPTSFPSSFPSSTPSSWQPSSTTTAASASAGNRSTWNYVAPSSQSHSRSNNNRRR